MRDQGNIEERLEHYAKRAMPHYPNDLCSEAKREIQRLRTMLADCSEERTIDSVPSCGQENDHRKASPQVSHQIEYPCKHELSEDCPACMQEEIERLRAEVDTLKTAITAPTKEEIDLRAQLDEASGETVRVQHELGELLHAAEAERDGYKAAFADLNDALSHLRAGLDKLKFRLREHNLVEIPIELHKRPPPR